jgi:hypothetical protein
MAQVLCLFRECSMSAETARDMREVRAWARVSCDDFRARTAEGRREYAHDVERDYRS